MEHIVRHHFYDDPNAGVTHHCNTIRSDGHGEPMFGLMMDTYPNDADLVKVSRIVDVSDNIITKVCDDTCQHSPVLTVSDVDTDYTNNKIVCRCVCRGKNHGKLWVTDTKR
jgi:hypothetical protein